jgi:alcohol dehydrogenase class IV
VPDRRLTVTRRSAPLLPHLATVDPRLTHAAPPGVTAATGRDALTPLIEAYVANAATPIPDALCRAGIRLAAAALRRAYLDGQDAAARADMSLASMYGGLVLANARLGAVHGFAGPCGGMFSAPHGCICGRFLPHVFAANVRALQRRAPDSPALPRFAEIAALLTGRAGAGVGDGVDWIQRLCGELVVPSLQTYGMTAADTEELVASARRASSMKGNPIELTHDELCQLVALAL